MGGGILKIKTRTGRQDYLLASAHVKKSLALSVWAFFYFGGK